MTFRKNKVFTTIFNMIIEVIDFVLLRCKLNILYYLKSIILSRKAKVIFVIEGGNWVIDWVGKYITENLKKLKLIDAEISNPFLVRNKIVHFGSINCFISDNGIYNLNKSNKKIVTWYHIDKNDQAFKFIPLLNKYIDLLHTSNIITKKELIELGLNENKIVQIPLGVDLSKFKRYNKNKRIQLRKKLNLPIEKIIIGSFQKDGVGWDDGLEPKYVKGPDIFCEVVRRLHKNFDIHIFLTGPARGYVKKKLKEYQIPFTHIFLDNYLDIVECYNVLDLYIITSRAEGGPNALLEGMATGVPLVTTNVGMASELINHGFNGFIAEIDDIDQLYKYSVELIKNKELREKFITSGFEIIKDYSWEKITKQYYLKLYRNLDKKIH